MKEKEKNVFYFKISKTGGKTYLQIWKKENDVSKYIYSCGTPENLYNKLVQADKDSELTKKFLDFRTKNPSLFNEDLD